MEPLASRPSASIVLYDTTLRDGAQMRGVSYTVADKLRITALLDSFGVHYLEAGWPGSNPKDGEFFEAIKKHAPRNLKLTAFGSTRRKGVEAHRDATLQALLRAETPAVAIFGKSWTLHVDEILAVSREENRAMISESVALLKREGREVIYDAEHFFDGYKANPAYALTTLEAALLAGADWITLCDTNGGTLPDEITRIVAETLRSLTEDFPNARFGIHTHNDAELAVANSLAAVQAGCRMVQGTINGYGERCGNANLISLVPTLQLKMGFDVIAPHSLQRLTEVARSVSEIANFAPNPQAPYAGISAFTHKAGVHAAAVEKSARSYEHIEPAVVGNSRQILASELSGRGNIRSLGSRFNLDVTGNEAQLLERIKVLEARGYQFEDAEASVALLMLRSQENYTAPFRLIDVMIVSASRPDEEAEAQAIVRLTANGKKLHCAADATGPIEATDNALRKALVPLFPALEQVRLVDYKVRILNPNAATGAMTRVTIQAQSGDQTWSTVGVSLNVIDASINALLESYEYFIVKENGIGEVECEKVAV